MDWKKKLRPASFRGVSFFIEESDRAGGRRIVDLEYPGRDNPSFWDLGRKTKVFSITAFVIGENYFESRDALLSACEDVEGEGELIHPFFGEQSVVCHDVSVKESMTKDGRKATFTITFKEAGLEIEPISVVDPYSAISEAVDAALKSSVAKLNSVLKVINQATQIVESAMEAVEMIANTLESLPLKGIAQGIAKFAAKANVLKNSISNLLQRPGELASFLGDSIKMLSEITGTKKESYRAYGVVSSSVVSTKTYSDSDSGKIQKSNDDALSNFMHEQGLINAVDAVFGVSFDCVTDAAKEKEYLSNLFDEILEKTDDDSFYITLSALKAVFLSNFPMKGESLPEVKYIEIPATLPSLLIAHKYLGDARREAEIVSRNRIDNPAFISGGTILEVIDG